MIQKNHREWETGVYENITNQKENANQNPDAISPRTYKDGYFQAERQQVLARTRRQGGTYTALVPIAIGTAIVGSSMVAPRDIRSCANVQCRTPNRAQLEEGEPAPQRDVCTPCPCSIARDSQET